MSQASERRERGASSVRRYGDHNRFAMSDEERRERERQERDWLRHWLESTLVQHRKLVLRWPFQFSQIDPATKAAVEDAGAVARQLEDALKRASAEMGL